MTVRVINDSTGKAEYYEYADLMRYREQGFPKEQPVIIPDEILTSKEVSQKKIKPPPQSASSSSVHATIGKILFHRRNASSSVTPPQKSKPLTHIQDKETDPLGYECF